MTNNQKLIKSQDGLVSIIVTLMFIIVISLIVFGFAKFSRQEQRSALDRQLSTQAFYAAESGINDVLKHGVVTATYTSKCTGAGSFINDVLSNTNVIDAANKVSYTCVLVDPSPATLKFSDVATDNATFADIQAVYPSTGLTANIAKIEFNWQGKDLGGAPYASGYPNLPITSAWGTGTGMLRVELTNLDVTNAFTRTVLNNQTYTAFLYPQTGTGSGTTNQQFNATASLKGSILDGHCGDAANNLLACRATIFLPVASYPTGSKHLFLRMNSIYNSNQVQIRAFDSSGTQLDLTGVQTMIDVTGKAQDVIRRIQVEVPVLSAGTQIPMYAVQSAGGICKRLQVASPAYFGDDGPCW